MFATEGIVLEIINYNNDYIVSKQNNELCTADGKVLAVVENEPVTIGKKKEEQHSSRGENRMLRFLISQCRFF